MLHTISNWDSISFPVYRVPTGHNIQKDGTVLYSYREFMEDESKTIVPIIRILDDTSIPGDTLGKRRMQLLQMKGVKLLKLPRAIYFFSDLIKLCTGSTSFIDSNGMVFTYTKSRSVPLIFKKITRKFPILNSIGTIIEIEGLPSRFKTAYCLKSSEWVAGLLKIDSSYILYGIYDELYDNTRRKV